MATKPYELRRRCNVGGIVYLLDDDDGTACAMPLFFVLFLKISIFAEF